MLKRPPLIPVLTATLLALATAAPAAGQEEAE